MCIIQNYLFFSLFWELWQNTGQSSDCLTTYFTLGFDTMTCFSVCILVFGVILGALVESVRLFCFFFVLHGIGGLAYSAAVVLVGLARFSDNGRACALIVGGGFGDRLTVVWAAQTFLYLAYTSCMGCIGYQAYGKRCLTFV